MRRRFLCGAASIQETKQYGGLRAELRGAGGVRGRGQPRRNIQSLSGLGTHDIHHSPFAQLTPHGFGSTDTDRRLLKGHAAKLSLTHGHRLGVVQRPKCRAQRTHRDLVTGTHRFRQCLTHTKTQRHAGDPMAAIVDPQRDMRAAAGRGVGADSRCLPRARSSSLCRGG